MVMSVKGVLMWIINVYSPNRTLMDWDLRHHPLKDTNSLIGPVTQRDSTTHFHTLTFLIKPTCLHPPPQHLQMILLSLGDMLPPLQPQLGSLLSMVYHARQWNILVTTEVGVSTEKGRKPKICHRFRIKVEVVTAQTRLFEEVRISTSVLCAFLHVCIFRRWGYSSDFVFLQR